MTKKKRTVQLMIETGKTWLQTARPASTGNNAGVKCPYHQE
ncbi:MULTISPECIES: hypothetical protein [Aquitalea]|nr:MULTISPECIES: hypothetical protein [Aquitalea]